jgi:hypothetical protein
MYLRIIDENITYPYSINQLRKDFPNVSIPHEITDEILLTFGMYNVNPTPKPNDYTKNIIEDTPQLIDGLYYQKWILEDITENEIQNKIEYKWSEIRNLRNELLIECDWTVLPDSPIGEKVNEWIVYRQELRNVTNQANPFFISWPTQPN